VFLLGLTPRTGTNYLGDLLRLHPACAGVGPVYEDFLLQEAWRLQDYADVVAGHWDPAWGVTGDHSAALVRGLGAGLRAFLLEELERIDVGPAPTEVVVTKTPSIAGLPLLRRLVPDARAVVLVRDGRAVVESGTRTFGRDAEWWMREWAAAADVLAIHADEAHVTVVRYEDLLGDLERELSRVLEALGLSPDNYDFAAAKALPVRGSSAQASEHGVSWDAARPAGPFDPLGRWRSWDRGRHRRFNWLAGQAAVGLGYTLVRGPGDRLLGPWQHALDLRWRVRGAREKGGIARAAVRRVARAG
jgi:hypothetical protein